LGATLEFVGSSVVQFRTDNYLEQASNLYDRALALRPSDDFLLADKGLVLIKLYDFHKAVLVLELATRINPLNLTAWRRLVTAYVMTRQHSKALDVVNYLALKGPLSENLKKTRELLTNPSQQ
jgi:tetratricopeptide (TPR) repeat protein